MARTITCTLIEGTSNFPACLDIYALTAAGDEIGIAGRITPDGAAWIAGELALIDDHDPALIHAAIADIRARFPRSLLFDNWVREWQRRDAKPVRKTYGRFARQGAA